MCSNTVQQKSQNHERHNKIATKDNASSLDFNSKILQIAKYNTSNSIIQTVPTDLIINWLFVKFEDVCMSQYDKVCMIEHCCDKVCQKLHLKNIVIQIMLFIFIFVF